VAVLLAFKGEIHGVAERLSEDDVKGIMQFALLSLVVLPVLPDRTFGPYMVLNPRQIWWMVVLIVGVGLAGYIAGKFVPERTSIPLNGFLGGLVSSTATTASYGKKAKEGSASPALAGAVITIASAVSLIRVVIEVGVVAPGLVRSAAGPLLTMAAVLLVLARVTYREAEMQSSGRALKNPSQVRGALAFAFLYALVLLISAAVKDRLGQAALYPVALVSGITDVDAITLTASRLFATGNVDLSHAWRLILTAALANLAAKAAFAGFLGGSRLLSKVAISFGACTVAGLAFFFLA
jgi:uncharacterized membrane protein (DUF4010 family)